MATFDPFDRTPEEARTDAAFAAIREVDTTRMTRGQLSRLMRERPRVRA